MIKLERTSVFNFENGIRGMRNPLESWDKSDSKYEKFWLCVDESGASGGNTFKELVESCGGFDIEFPESYDVQYVNDFQIGDKDLALMRKLAFAGSDHRKFLRQIMVSVDITAPLYWWKEFDTYKVGTVANSCSTMHTIHKRDLTLDDFSHEHVTSPAISALHQIIAAINILRRDFIETKDKECWYQMIQLLPSSYNQMRTVTLNYEVLLNQYHARKAHKLNEWHTYCDWVESLPYFKEICL